MTGKYLLLHSVTFALHIDCIFRCGSISITAGFPSHVDTYKYRRRSNRVNNIFTFQSLCETVSKSKCYLLLLSQFYSAYKKKQWIRKYHHKTTKAPPAYLRLPIILPIVNYLSPSPPPPLTINIMISGNSKPKNSLNPSQSLLQCFTALIKLIPLSFSPRSV